MTKKASGRIVTAKSMSLDLNGINPQGKKKKRKGKGAETTGTNESEQREKMKPKSSCCQFYPIRLCGKRRTQKKDPREEKPFFWNQKENKGRRETRRQGIETPERRGREDSRYCWGQIEATKKRKKLVGLF